jgi:hypothetical protein
LGEASFSARVEAPIGWRALSRCVPVQAQVSVFETALLFPHRFLGGGTAPLSPFQRSLRSLPPLLGLGPATKGSYPLGTPAALLPQISKLARSAPRSPLAKPRGTVLARRSTGFSSHRPSPASLDNLLRTLQGLAARHPLKTSVATKAETLFC